MWFPSRYWNVFVVKLVKVTYGFMDRPFFFFLYFVFWVFLKPNGKLINAVLSCLRLFFLFEFFFFFYKNTHINNGHTSTSSLPVGSIPVSISIFSYSLLCSQTQRKLKKPELSKKARKIKMLQTKRRLCPRPWNHRTKTKTSLVILANVSLNFQTFPGIFQLLNPWNWWIIVE